ncbi:MAG: magnesium transporter [Bacteroidota bacterium]|jgi:magnesium transporter
MRFELTKDFLENIRLAIQTNDLEWIDKHVLELHYVDIAEILDELQNEEAKFIYFRLEEDVQADVLMELEEEVRDRFIKSLSTKEIAEQLENLDSDDAADILYELSDNEIHEVISQMEDDEAADDIVDLLNYDEDTAGGLMQKEFLFAQIDWTVEHALTEIREQAKDVEKVYTIYVVDSLNKLAGVLSLKSLFFSEPQLIIKDLFQSKNIISVKVTEEQEEVMRLFDKYGLVSIPVLDYQDKLVGRITIDDVVDIIREEADRDFQLATGITEKVEDNASVFKITRARLPWLIIGMLGGTLGAKVISSYEGNISLIPALAFFIPMITAMGGNVGVQSSAIVVQSLAKGNQFKSIFSKLGKELLVGLLNGLICSSLIFGIGSVFGTLNLGLVVSISLFVVIIFASVMGTLIPLILDKYDIDPALATGPFITTLNDVLGLFIYFTVAMLIFA